MKTKQKMLTRASFGSVGYINISILNTGSVSKSVYGKNNSKKMQDALKKANKTLDRLYEKYQ